MEESPSLTLCNVETALQCLTLGSANIKEAEGALLSWQKHQVNAYTFILLCTTLNPQVRLAALLSLKAVVKQSWKDRGRTQRQLLDEATKQQVRCVLLSIVTTGENPLCQQETIEQQYRNQYIIESVISDRTVQSAATSCLVQVAMFDLPKQSQDLIPFLVSHAMSQQQSALQKRNSLFALEALLEELSEKRLLGVKKYMRTVAINHVAMLIQEGVGLVSMLLAGSALDSIMSERCLLLVSIIHYLLQTSLSTILESPGDASTAVDEWMKLALNVSAAFSSGTNLVPLRLCKGFWELVVQVQEANPIAFGRYLEPFLSMYYNVLFVGFDETSTMRDPRALLAYYEARISQPSPVPDELLILALRFLANVASCSQYVPDETTNEAVPVVQCERGFTTNITSKGDAQLRISDVQNAVHAVWKLFFSSERVCNLVDICVCHFMTISPTAVEEWTADPEGYFLSEEHRTADDNVSLAAQNLFCSLVESLVARPVVLPRLVALLRDTEPQMQACRREIVSSEASSVVDPVVVLWEAIYTAAGLAASLLDDYDAWDFPMWYHATLGPCLDLLLSNNADTHAVPLLRRRVIWLVGCNASRLPSGSLAFKGMVNIIAADTSTYNDIAVKLSATQAVSIIVGNFDEAAEECVPNAEFIISSLYRLADECDELDSQAIVLDATPLILAYITGTGRDITPSVANAAVTPLPSVWDASTGERVLLRRNVINVLVIVASSIGTAGVERLLPIALPIIASSLDTRTRTELSFLVDETLLLWLTILRFTDTYTLSIGSLFPLVVGLLEVDFEHLRMVMMISETYIMLGGNAFLAANAESLSKVLTLTVAQVRARGAKYVGLLLESLLREYPSDGGLLLLHSGILGTMLHSCMLNSVGDEQCEPDRVISMYLTSLARVLYTSPRILDGSLPTNAGGSFGYKELLQLYLNLLNKETSVFSQILWMKLLCSLLPFQPQPPEPQLQTAFVGIMNDFLVHCVEVLPKLKSARVLGYYQPDYDSDEETIDAGHERYEAMCRNSQSKDTLATLDLKDLSNQRLTYLCRSCGDRIDPQLLVALKQMLQ